ncbi:HalOD1 output domain-containing protein [Halobellus salinisoli]|uniref:HalOD1 output domain-containing protein n=1 Tax=Halobellus salinisoli TaxID=3108500 RepID=UPI00300A69F8
MQSEHPSATLVEAVAAATGQAMTDLPPLHRSIDPDALDALLTRGQSSSVTVSFRYADTDVSMNENGSIEIQVDGTFREGDDE